MGKQPGDEATAQGVVTAAAMLALLTGIVYWTGVSLRGDRSRAGVLVPVAAAALVVTKHYSFDSYYLPSLIRFSEEDSVPTAWIYGVAACSGLVAFAIRVRPRLGLGATPILLLVCAGTVVAEGFGK